MAGSTAGPLNFDDEELVGSSDHEEMLWHGRAQCPGHLTLSSRVYGDFSYYDVMLKPVLVFL
jgi:hypothetical protein